MSATLADTPDTRDAIERLMVALRPKLHRYCARMTGSVIDGEDVVQEAMLKAMEAVGTAGPIDNPEGWLFRIAHNTALDVLRRRARRDALLSDEDAGMIVDPVQDTEKRQVAAASLHTFMRLPVMQRSSIILMDVLGYSLEEVGSVTGATVPAVKAALHRGRARLTELAREPDDRAHPRLEAGERARLAAYVDRFNARDFDAVRDMLADDVRLELVARTRAAGRNQVGRYFSNYDRIHDWRLAPGFVDRRPAVLVRSPGAASARPAYFVLLEWTGDAVATIRDFRYARYVADEAEIIEIA